MRVSRILGLVVLAALSGSAFAKTPPVGLPNPSLTARVQGIDDEAHLRALPIADLQVEINIVGTIARTTLRIRFSNPTEDQLEGDFKLQLPDEAVVTGYALDVGGRMVDGVLAAPERARGAYEARVRQRIDPGLAEVSRGNVFSTRVFPIDSEMGRTIRVTFVAPIHAETGWSLPFATERPIRNVKFSLRAEGVASAPELTLPSGLEAQWTGEGGAFETSAVATRKQLTGELRFAATAAKPLLTTLHATGKRYFQLNDVVPVENRSQTTVDRVRIYWDRSLSRKDDGLAAEIALAARYVEAVKAAHIDVVLFNSSGATVQSATTASGVRQLLNAAVYRGASSFAVLESTKAPQATTCLMFSDGIATLDRRDRFKPDCELMAISTAADAEVGYLARLMNGPAAGVIRLDRIGEPAALAGLLNRAPAVVEVRTAAGAMLPFTSLPAPHGRLAAVAEAPASGEVVVVVSRAGSSPIERRYVVDSAATRFDGAGSLWAADRVTQLAALEKKKELRALSQRYTVASTHMSFIVLEVPDDYVRAEITPPRSHSKEWMAQYREAKAEWDEERAEERAERLNEVIARWEDVKRWWATDFDPAAKPAVKQRRAGREAPTPMAASSPMIAMEDSARVGGTFDSAPLQEVAVTGGQLARGRAGATIELEPWNVDRPYIKALDAASATQIDRVLSAQEKAHGSLPAFYLDVAEWMNRKGRRAQAIEVLLSALELPSRNAETLTVVADRMLRYGQIDRAIWLYTQVLELADDRPQPRRALALALAERAKKAAAADAKRDLERAMALYNEVVTTDWVGGAYDGIEVIALMEANALVPRLEALGVSKVALDPRLIAKLDVDLRVVIEWNTAATDMDLWVYEPNGDAASYSNKLTVIGGRLSNDMTEGFGPEEYLLRRAPDGRYRISVNVFATDRINPNGVTTVTARLIRDFGRPTEHTELLDLELGPEQAGEMKLGAFVMGEEGSK